MLKLKNLLLVFGAFLAISLPAELAHANTCFLNQSDETCFPIGTVTGQFGDLHVPPVGLASDGTGSFQIPQFDPRLGQLQDVVLNVNIVGVTGTISYVYTGITQQCIDQGFGTGCQLLNLGAANVSVLFTSGSFYSQSAGPAFGPGAGNTPVCFAPCSIPGSGQWQTDLGGGSSASLLYEAAHATPFVGTGQVTFNVTAGAEPFVNGPATLTGFSVDSVDYSANVDYDFTPAASPVPEPSLLALTGGLLGLVVAGKRIVAK